VKNGSDCRGWLVQVKNNSRRHFWKPVSMYFTCENQLILLSTKLLWLLGSWRPARNATARFFGGEKRVALKTDMCLPRSHRTRYIVNDELSSVRLTGGWKKKLCFHCELDAIEPMVAVQTKERDSSHCCCCCCCWHIAPTQAFLLAQWHCTSFSLSHFHCMLLHTL
jgi:hypothetical protein